jgi:hypothetical protein
LVVISVATRDSLAQWPRRQNRRAVIADGWTAPHGRSRACARLPTHWRVAALRLAPGAARRWTPSLDLRQLSLDRDRVRLAVARPFRINCRTISSSAAALA